VTVKPGHCEIEVWQDTKDCRIEINDTDSRTAGHSLLGHRKKDGVLEFAVDPVESMKAIRYAKLLDY
jgi:hypothetical protein